MTKFGKIVLVMLVLGGIFIFSAAAEHHEWTREQLQELYLENIAVEGYRPVIDGDGDIEFKVLGSNYFVIVDESDQGFFQIYTGFWLDNITMEEAYKIVNEANRKSKVAKISLSTSGPVYSEELAFDEDGEMIFEETPERIIVSITAELLVENPEDFTLIFSRAISLLANARNIFQTQLAAR